MTPQLALATKAQALILKIIGYDVPTIWAYDIDSFKLEYLPYNTEDLNSLEESRFVAAPYIEAAIEFLFNAFDLSVEVSRSSDNNGWHGYVYLHGDDEVYSYLAFSTTDKDIVKTKLVSGAIKAAVKIYNERTAQ